jgi:hypothetical protein
MHGKNTIMEINHNFVIIVRKVVRRDDDESYPV